MNSPQPEKTIDALVVGAGPVGLMMAAELARHGLSCRICDKSAAATDKSKALVVWSRTLEQLEFAGAVEPFLAAGLKGHGANIYSGGQRLVHVSLELDSPYDYALFIPQSETERLLAAEVERRGIRIERNTELLLFDADEEGVTSTIRTADGSKEIVRSSWLLGCDGCHSRVRHQLDVPFSGDSEPNDWMLADLHIRGTLAKDELTIFFHREGVLALFPIVGGRYRVIADLGLAKTTERAADPTLGEVQDMLDRRGPGGLTAQDAVWLSGFRIHERKVAAYRRGRVFLAGDAAHIHSPAGGQGMNTGMQDAFNLAWKLALANQGHAQDLLLDSYSTERSAVGEQVLRNAAMMTRAATLRNPVAQHFRDHLYWLFGSLGVVQHRIADSLAELSINYRHGPITGEHRELSAHAWLLGGGIPAGNRAPDAALEDAESGVESRLFRLLHTTRHTLLLMTGVDTAADTAELHEIRTAVEKRFPGLVDSFICSPAPVAGATHLDPQLALHKRYAAGSRTLYLIRPDGYVGYRSQPASAAALIAHMETYLR